MDNEVLIGGNSNSFASYMFSLSEGEKVDLLNMLQYVILAIIPILLVNKLIKTYLPPVDRTKSSIELTTEIVIQLVLLFVFIFFIHKLILFIPTYTKNPYPAISFLPIILPLLIVLFSLDKNLNEKSTMLMNKVFVMIGLNKENFQESESECSDKKNNKPQSKQPEVNLLSRPQISNPSTLNFDQPYEAPMRKSDYDQSQEFGIPSYMSANEPVAANSFSSFI
jgi:hypothetical protein